MKINVHNLEKIMIEKKLSNIELSEMSGISRQHMSSILNGKTNKVRFKTIGSLSEALKVDYKKIILEE